jgi:molybdopterin-guanine dinucleotide biosynthesis protein A
MIITGDGRTFLDKICDEVDECFGKCIDLRILSLREGQTVFRDGYMPVYDRYDDIGPLGGLISILEKAVSEGIDACLIIACDMINYTAEEIRRICELIVEGLSNREISIRIMKEFNTDSMSEGYIRIIRYCSPIYQPELWKIVKEYKDRFPNRTNRHSTETIEKICSGLNRGLRASEIAEEVGLTNDKKFRALLSRIRSKLIYTEISDKYAGINSINNGKIITSVLAEKIYVMSHQGYKPAEIAKAIASVHALGQREGGLALCHRISQRSSRRGNRRVNRGGRVNALRSARVHKSYEKYGNKDKPYKQTISFLHINHILLTYKRVL